ncbi:uncharacterized protein An01g05300, partial [Aspergillus niger]|uniref:Contig An01c0190, genomic contig n=2 Tax=Aspergillus niger TaxID=5061 RepID=A2Q8R6_ASPNC
MSAPGGAPSPAPRSGSMGPGGGMSMPPQQPMTNAGPVTPGPPAPPPPPPGGPMSQQNLNQIVIDYLAKKGYSRTEAMLRIESAHQEIDGRPPMPPLGEDARPKYRMGFDLLKVWVEDNLDLYKPELRRVLWPLFVYTFINMVSSFKPQDAKQFFDLNKNLFLPEHTEDVRALEPISLPEHVQANSTAKLYRTNKYRLVLSNPAFSNLMQFLESKQKEGGSDMTAILRVIALSSPKSVLQMIGSVSRRCWAKQTVRHFPVKTKAFLGTIPDSAYTGDNPNMAGTLPRLKLGKLPLEQALETDVRGELADEDAKNPPGPGQNTLIQEFDQMIKKEEDEEAPTRADIPYPPSTARDVAIEIQKVKENRDRFRIEGRTGGVGPAVSVCMFTFHNTYDGINCLDFSDDLMLVAAGMQESYIRVWSMDGKKIQSTYDNVDDAPPSNSRRLIGHSGPVYAVAFAPSITKTDNAMAPTNARWLLSSSADKTIRLWSLDLWQCMVVYKGHDQPVWDLQWGPYGHYFVSGGHDKTARLWVTDHIRQQRIFVGHDQDVDCICFHPNSAYVFTGSSDHTVRMWAVTTGNAVRMFTGHTGNITALACSRDGKLLASADDHGSILLWDLAPGRLLKRMRGHGKGGIWSLSWSVESTVLVSGGADGTVRVWDVTGPAQDPSQGRVVGEGGAGTKVDGSNQPAPSTAQTSSAVAPGMGKKKGKDVVVTPDQISAFPTKKSPVYKVKFTNMNLIIAGGAYLP